MTAVEGKPSPVRADRVRLLRRAVGLASDISLPLLGCRFTLQAVREGAVTTAF